MNSKILLIVIGVFALCSVSSIILTLSVNGNKWVDVNGELMTHIEAQGLANEVGNSGARN